VRSSGPAEVHLVLDPDEAAVLVRALESRIRLGRPLTISTARDDAKDSPLAIRLIATDDAVGSVRSSAEEIDLTIPRSRALETAAALWRSGEHAWPWVPGLTATISTVAPTP
jgi:hypothetical protein